MTPVRRRVLATPEVDLPAVGQARSVEKAAEVSDRAGRPAYISVAIAYFHDNQQP